MAILSAPQPDPDTAPRPDEAVADAEAIAQGEQAQQLIAFLMAAEPDCIDCRDLLDVIARYVDLEALHGLPPDWMPDVDGHLDHCGDCQELYQVLRSLARSDAAAAGDLERIWERVREQVRALEADAA